MSSKKIKSIKKKFARLWTSSKRSKKTKLIKTIVIDIAVFITILGFLFFIAEGISRLVFTFKTDGPTAINMQIYENNPVYAWGHKANSLDYHGYGKPTPEVRINSMGFRDDEYPLEKPEDTIRILVLGDSFAFGMGVAKDDNFTERLETKLNENPPEEGKKYEVINTGAIGYTTANEYLLYMEKGRQLKPDIVMLEFFTGNDVTENRRHDWLSSKDGIPTAIRDTEHYVDEQGRLRYRGENEPVSYFADFVYKRWLILMKKLNLAYEDSKPTLTWPAYLDPQDPNGDPRIPEFWDKTELVLQALIDELESTDTRFILFSVPMDVQTDKKYWGKHLNMHFDEEAYELDRPQTKLHELSETFGFEYIELLKYFRKDQGDEWFYYEFVDPHWTVEGNEFVANILYNYLSKNEQNENN